jgi:hypothetical protein
MLPLIKAARLSGVLIKRYAGNRPLSSAFLTDSAWPDSENVNPAVTSNNNITFFIIYNTAPVEKIPWQRIPR